MPLVQIIGVTSTSKSYSVAFSFVSNEREDTFVCVLDRLKYTLNKCMEPRVIVTDRDLALMNACAKVFPNAMHVLCRWHILENIKLNNRPRF